MRSNPSAHTTVDIDKVRQLDPQGRDQLANGDFSAGLDRWFFKSNDHLPWHIKNLWVHTRFEQGVLGLMALAALVLAARRARDRSRPWGAPTSGDAVLE